MERVKDILKEIRELLEGREHWTTEALARNKEGRRILPDSADAISWDLNGSVLRIIMDKARPDRRELYSCVLNAIGQAAKDQDLLNFNDTHTYADIIEALDKAVITEEEKYAQTLLKSTTPLAG